MKSYEAHAEYITAALSTHWAATDPTNKNRVCRRGKMNLCKFEVHVELLSKTKGKDTFGEQYKDNTKTRRGKEKG